MKRTKSWLHNESAHGPAPPRAALSRTRPRTPGNPGHPGDTQPTRLQPDAQPTGLLI